MSSVPECGFRLPTLPFTVKVNAIETANLNAETMIAMKKGAEALKGIHGNMYAHFATLTCVLEVTFSLCFLTNRNINKVDATMDQIREQMDISNEISDAISNPVNMGIDVDDVSPASPSTEMETNLDVFDNAGGAQE